MTHIAESEYIYVSCASSSFKLSLLSLRPSLVQVHVPDISVYRFALEQNAHGTIQV